MSPDWSGSPEAVPYASLGDPQSLNLYAYAGNDPVDGEDPDGHSIYSLGNGIYDNLSGLQQYVMDTDEARPASGDNHSVQCNSFLCSAWQWLKSNVSVGGGGGSSSLVAQEQFAMLFSGPQESENEDIEEELNRNARSAHTLRPDGNADLSAVPKNAIFPNEKGPMAGNDARNFQWYAVWKLERDTVVYRYWGGNARLVGRGGGTYYSLFPPSGSEELFRDSFVLPREFNSMEHLDAVTIPAGTTVYWGPAARSSDYPGYQGGGLQVLVPY
jgi:hypothetical protein